MGNIAVNRINICKTEYQTSHINCAEDNSFILQSLIETIKNTDGSYKITSFKTIIIRENTIYYLEKNGMKVLGKFDNSTKILNIEVKLTTDINQSSNSSASNYVKTNIVEQIRNLKKDDIIDFHLKIKNEDVYEDLGSTKCPDCLEGSSNCLDNLLFSINYNYCASIITCE